MLSDGHFASSGSVKAEESIAASVLNNYSDLLPEIDVIVRDDSPIGLGTERVGRLQKRGRERIRPYNDELAAIVIDLQWRNRERTFFDGEIISHPAIGLKELSIQAQAIDIQDHRAELTQ